MKKVISILALTLFCGVLFAQEPAAPTPSSNNAALLESAEAQANASQTEAGKYERKSVSYIDALWLMDASVRGMPAEYVGNTLEAVKKKIMMPRFDYNALPEAVTADFVAKANAMTEITIDNIATLMDETIVPKILAIVDLNKELRAQNYTSEAQRNSFYAIKAKEYGFTDVELAKVMNSAFIFIPVAKSYSGVTAKGQYTMKMDVGILWYRISTKGEKAVAKLVVKKMTSSMGFAKDGKTFKRDGKVVNSQQCAFIACVKNAARNLLVATQEMPEFRLSGQVVENDAGTVGFDLGKKEGLLLDDKYQIVELEEMSDGSVKQTNNGWVVVSMVADSNSKEGYKSKAKLIAGDPMTGSILSEFPRIPIDLAIKFRTFAGAKDANDKDVFGSAVGLQIDARYNVGRTIGVSQLFAGVGYGFGSASVSDDYKSTYEGATLTTLDIFAMKKFLIKRFTAGVEVGFALAGIKPTYPGAGAASLALDPYSCGGLFFGGNLGMCLTPALNVEASVRYEMGTVEITNWAHDGIGIHAGLIWSPPSLPFDPVDYVRGKAGI